jgi:hypothetical protein
MSPILLSPLVKWSLVALGGGMVVHWVVKEARRINEELDAAKRVRVPISDRENRPTLRRDPATGEYRL